MINKIKQRFIAVEKELRLIYEDILAVKPHEIMYILLINTKSENVFEKKKNID